jgi:hypothetical protein
MINESNRVTICDKRQTLQNDLRAQSACIALWFVIF